VELKTLLSSVRGSTRRPAPSPRDIRAGRLPVRAYPLEQWFEDAPPLGFPFSAESAAMCRIPDDWTVWAFADIHGVLTGLREVLGEAGLTNDDGHWIGGSKTALVGLGDYIDRGADSAGVVSLLRALGPEMDAAGSRLVLVRGNHEQMLADILRGFGEWFDAWTLFGGRALAHSYGLTEVAGPLEEFRQALLAAAPDLLPWLLATHPFARWREVVFVHAGLPKEGVLGTLPLIDEQLWDLETFLTGPGIALDPDLWGFREGGIGRVVVGHYPQHLGPTVDHDGTLLLLDTNAASEVSPWRSETTAFATLARIPPSGTLDATHFVMVDTSRAPDRAPSR
jgi:serine/threonine protein phosphatase 1